MSFIEKVKQIATGQNAEERASSRAQRMEAKAEERKYLIEARAEIRKAELEARKQQAIRLAQESAKIRVDTKIARQKQYASGGGVTGGLFGGSLLGGVPSTKGKEKTSSQTYSIFGSNYSRVQPSSGHFNVMTGQFNSPTISRIKRVKHRRARPRRARRRRVVYVRKYV